MIKNENKVDEPERKVSKKKGDNYISTQKIKKPNLYCILLNLIFSVIVLFFSYKVYGNYEKKWQICLYLTFWSLFMNVFYIVSITVLDFICRFKEPLYRRRCIRFNDFVRNSYLRITFPFAISIVFLYWLLILLGDDFQYASRSLWDNCISFSFHGLIFFFLLFDTLSYPHINRMNKLLDIGVITAITGVYFIVLGVGKYELEYDPYDFMLMSNLRQISAAGILIYMTILDGYVVFVLVSNKFFLKEEKVIKKQIKENKIEEKAPLKIEKIQNDKIEQKGAIQIDNIQNNKEDEKVINNDGNNYFNIVNIMPNKKKKGILKPINLSEIKKKMKEESKKNKE
jgi:hypothetical protein